MSSGPSDLRLLITRPEPGATKLATRFAERGFRVDVAPLFHIVPHTLPPLKTDALSALLLTSPRAAALVPDALLGLPAFVVGSATRRAAEERGLHIEAEGAGELDDRLTNQITPGTRVLHLAGRHLARDIAPALQARRIHYEKITAYDAEAVQDLPDTAAKHLHAGGERAVTFLSARAAKTYATLVRKAGLEAQTQDLSAFCLSPRVASAAAADLTYRRLAISPSTDLTSFVDFIASSRT